MSPHRRIKIFSDAVFLAFSLILLFSNLSVWKWVESLSLFVPDSFFFQRFLHIPGGLLAYLGCFLTQTLYYPIAGCLLLTLLLLAVQKLTSAVFEFSEEDYPLSFLPSFMLLTSVVNLGYTWITLKAIGHFFTPTLGYCLILLCAFLYIHIKHPLWRGILLLLFVACYPFFGFYALCATGLCLLMEWKIKGDIRTYLLFLVLGGAAIGLTPKICYYSIANTEQEISRMYLGGMPDFFVRQSELMLWMPFLILIGSLIAFAFRSSLTIRTPIKLRWIPTALFLSALLFTISQTYHDENFMAAVRTNLAIDENDWNKALHATQSVKGQPTRDVIINGELAQVMLGMPKANQELPPLPVSYKDSRPSFFTFTQLCGMHMLFYMGQINLCYRWGMELSVEYGWRVSCLKYMVKCALLQGEYALANKYNNLLMKTAFHKDWAKKYQTYIDHPERMKENQEFTQISALMQELPNMFIE